MAEWNTTLCAERMVIIVQIKTINGLTVEDALQQYEPMIHKVVNAAKTNYVCNYEDMVQEGRLAVIEAFNNYDANKGAALSTWMYRYISGAILDYQKTNLSILAGGHYLQDAMKKAGPDATVEDLLALGYTRSTALASTYINENYTGADFEQIKDFIEDPHRMEDNIELCFFDWRKYLTEKEATVLSHLYGFDGGEPLTKIEIGKKMGLNRHTVGDIVMRAICKLRHCPEIVDYAFD